MEDVVAPLLPSAAALFDPTPSQFWSGTTTAAAPNSTSECFGARGRNSVLQGTPFGGVVIVLAIDFVVWMALLLLFSVLRKVAWDYGRLALLNDNDRAYEETVYGSTRLVRPRKTHMDLRETRRAPEPLVAGRWKDYNYFTGLYKERNSRPQLETQNSVTDYESKDKGFCSWLTAIFRIKDEEIKHKCGIDAVHYLSFQRHIIALLIIICILSLAVILPVNFSGTLQGGSPTNFGRTTIGNLESTDKLLWLHTMFAILYLIITILVMRHHSANLPYEEDEVVSRTLFIIGIPKHLDKEDILKSHFYEAYPSCTITDVQFCYNVEKLIKLDKERKKAAKARAYYDNMTDETMRPKMYGELCCCDCYGYRKVNALEFYTALESRLTDECEEEKRKIPDNPLGMAFVTFHDDKSATQVMRDYKKLRCLGSPKTSSFGDMLRSKHWGVKYAPDPNSIIWENLTVQGFSWWVKVIVLNTFLFILLFFFSTPSIVVNTIDKFNVTKPVESLNSPIITQFLPTLLLWTFSSLLPLLVYYSVFLEAHWTRSSENRATMHKCYFFLIFMVLILPSLGLTSLNVFFRWLFDKNFLKDGSIRFECVFLPDNGAFFVNFVITAGFIGTAMELLRVPGLMLYALRLCSARSMAERKNVKQEQAYEFQFGQAYAWMMTVFTVVMAYSITCPIIVVFGVIYVLLKHMVDRYNLYYAYIPSKLNRKIHCSAINQVVAAPILCIFWLLFYSVVRLGPRNEITVFTFVVLLFTIVVCLFRMFFGYFKYLSVHNYKDSMVGSPPLDDEGGTPTTPQSPTYKASVLFAPSAVEEESEVMSPQSYGSMDKDDEPNHNQSKPQGAPMDGTNGKPGGGGGGGDTASSGADEPDHHRTQSPIASPKHGVQ
uniref:LOW QUALITY PROTEIN: CSC1-like protein 2 n=1 Tax=Petromyzon marinus TaxID=7757 RepID=A0AAJ7TKY3_PETMA|nr:LOW QUALITY PROTEIN: CSC1-like protein 2 [Petromyzon marinus]